MLDLTSRMVYLLGIFIWLYAIKGECWTGKLIATPSNLWLVCQDSHIVSKDICFFNICIIVYYRTSYSYKYKLANLRIVATRVDMGESGKVR